MRTKAKKTQPRKRKTTKELPPVYGFSKKTLDEWADKAFEQIRRPNPAQGDLFT